MRGYVRKEIMIDAELLDKFNEQCRIRPDTGGYREPTISLFVNCALDDYMDEFFSDYPSPVEH